MTVHRTLMAEAAAQRGDPWLVIHDAVFAGLNHALSNRVMGLESFVTIATRRGSADWNTLAAEAARLEKLLQLYRLLEVSASERAEPMHVSEPTADAMDLLGHHLALREVPVVSDGAPAEAVVSLPRRLAARAFLVLLHEAARRADRDGATVHWRYEIGADDVTVLATTRPAADADDDPVLLEAARPLVAGAPDAVWSVLDPGRSYVAAMRLPLSLAARRH
jgi:hypothetical protein